MSLVRGGAPRAEHAAASKTSVAQAEATPALSSSSLSPRLHMFRREAYDKKGEERDPLSLVHFHAPELTKATAVLPTSNSCDTSGNNAVCGRKPTPTAPCRTKLAPRSRSKLAENAIGKYVHRSQQKRHDNVEAGRVLKEHPALHFHLPLDSRACRGRNTLSKGGQKTQNPRGQQCHNRH